MRVMITGARGFIGRHLVAALGARHEVLAPVRPELDLLDGQAVRRYLQAHPVDVVVHAATTPGHRNAPPVADLYERNLRMFSHLAECGDHWARMIVLGSGSEYDMTRPLERVCETSAGERLPADPSGRSKLEISQRCAADARFTVLRLFGVFGPHEDWEIRFISNAICKALHRLPITLRQDRRFHYLWVEDLAPIVERMMARTPRHAAYNVTPDEAWGLRALAERVRERTGTNVPVQVATPGEGLAYTGANDRLRAEWPDLRFTPIGEAVDRLIAWYERHHAEIDPDRLRHDK